MQRVLDPLPFRGQESFKHGAIFLIGGGGNLPQKSPDVCGYFQILALVVEIPSPVSVPWRRKVVDARIFDECE